MKKTLFLVVLYAGSFCAPASADVSAKLDTFYKQVKSMQADFEQTVVDANSRLVQKAKGHLSMQRPGKFRWDYVEPYEQTIVSNGSKIWIYDVDLEQVTTKSMDSVIGNTPALLLSGGTSLKAQFNISQEKSTDGVDRIVLRPKDKEVSFTLVRLSFEKDRLKQMELMDNFGQTTQLIFSRLKNNPVLVKSLFEFKVPEGVDVIGE